MVAKILIYAINRLSFSLTKRYFISFYALESFSSWTIDRINSILPNIDSGKLLTAKYSLPLDISNLKDQKIKYLFEMKTDRQRK